MGRSHNKINSYLLANVAASAATNNTFYYYVDMHEWRKAGFQFEWTAGGTGTVTVTFEGTLQDDTTVQASCTYQDITNATFGVASWTDDFMAIDSQEKLACFHYVRCKVVTLTVDANTAWKLYAKTVA